MKILRDEDFAELTAEQESQFFADPADFADEVQQRIMGTYGNFGDELPWSKTHGKVAFRPSEVSIWAGINGHGKSQMLGMAAAWWLLKKRRVLICSLEMPPSATLYRMARQCSGMEQPSSEWTQEFLATLKDRLWIYDQTDTVEPERIIGMIRYAATRLGIHHIIIDSLVKCGLDYGPDSLKQQKEFVDTLAWLAKKHKVHIHLVHHMRKGESEERVPGKFEIKGAGEITDLADNVIVVHRNKRKERDIATLKPDDERYKQSAEQFDQTLSVVKQRHGEYEGTFGFHYHKPSMQYVPKAGKRMPYELGKEGEYLEELGEVAGNPGFSRPMPTPNLHPNKRTAA